MTESLDTFSIKSVKVFPVLEMLNVQSVTRQLEALVA